MNCLEFRRLNLSDPTNRNPEYLAHRLECEDCARYADGVNVLDKKLENALRVPVPEDLAVRIKLRQLMLEDETEKASFWNRPLRFGMAASVLLVVTLGSLFGYEVHATNQYINRLTVSAVDHTRIERQGNHFLAHQFLVQPDDTAVQITRLSQILAAFGGKVMYDELAAVGEILDVQVCALDTIDTPVAHFVIRTASGEKITVYYILGKKLKKRADSIYAHYKSLLVPAGSGNIALIATSGDELGAVADALKQAIVWPI